MDGGDSIPWISDSEKYGLVGLSINVEGHIPSGPMTPNLGVLAETTFTMPTNWREWLGSIRADDVEDCNLFLLSKLPSTAPDVLDGENKRLQQLVWNFYTGLLVANMFAPAHRPVLLTGARRGGEIDLRQHQDIDPPVPTAFRPYPPIGPNDLRLAARLAENLDVLATVSVTGGHWRLFRTLAVYIRARTESQIVDRIHQYSRCIDGMILPAIGKTRQQFKSRTELFIGSHHHDLMGEIYDVRSDVEHLHEYRYLETFDRAVRLDLVKKEAFVEYIARTNLAHIIGDSNLWPYFGNTTALAAFWALQPADRRQLWGQAVDPNAALVDFDPRYIQDSWLGA